MSGPNSGAGGANPEPGSGPYVPVYPDPVVPVSPLELAIAIVEGAVERSICPNVCGGPAELAWQQEGVCSLTDAGASQTNPHMPVIWRRIQCRCVAHTMSHAEQIGMHIYSLLHTRHRELVQQPSTDQWYLVYRTQCVAEPSTHYDGPSTWESLAFYEFMVGTVPTVGAPGEPSR